MNSSRWIIFIIYLLGCFQSNAHGTEDRVAFIIGNASYAGPAKLINPINDANAIAKVLESAGFQVHRINDLLASQVDGLRKNLEQRITPHSVLIIYYAGHGIQVDGRNYLLPTDGKAIDDSLLDEALYLGDLLAIIEKKRPKISAVILDACRDNPFRHSNNSKLKTGLARVDPPSSTVVFYATRPGGLASDGTEGNGLFTKALLSEMGRPHQPLEVVFRRTAAAVFNQSRGEQEPWLEGVIREEFVINSGLLTTEGQAASNEQTTPSGRQPVDSIALTLSPALVKPTQVVALHEAYDTLRSIKRPEQEPASTLFACDSQHCEDYKNWMKHADSERTKTNINSFQKTVLKSERVNICEFSLEQQRCITSDVRLPFYGPNLIVSNKVYSDGFGLRGTSISKSGGMVFDAIFFGGAVLYFGRKTQSNCQPSAGKINFERDQLSMDIARTSCLNNFTVSLMKTTINVLLLNHANSELIAELDIGFFGLGFGAVVGGGKKVVKISFI